MVSYTTSFSTGGGLELILNCIFLTDNLEFNYNLLYLDGKAANEGVRGGNTHLLAPHDINNVCCNYLS